VISVVLRMTQLQQDGFALPVTPKQIVVMEHRVRLTQLNQRNAQKPAN